MNDQDKTKVELRNKLLELQQKYDSLKVSYEKDITERKQAELALSQRESYLSAIIENQPGLLWLKDKESSFLAVNQKFAISNGKKSRQELVGKTDFDIWPTELAEKYRRDDFMIMERGKPVVVEEQIYDQGIMRWFETFKNPVYDGQGTLMGTTGYAHDITERKRMELELLESKEKAEESEERFRSLYENSTIGLYRTSPDGKILLANPTLVKMLLFDSYEDLCKRNLEMEGFDTSHERKEFVERIEKEKVIIGLESVWNRKDNTPIYVRESAKAISDSNGKTLYYDGTIENITERKRIDLELLESKEKAEESDRLKTAFMNNISHEIRTPLNAILGFAPFVIEPNISQEEKEMFLNTLNVSGERLLNTVNDYMDISLIVSNSMEVHSKLVDISLLFSKLYESFKKPCILKNLELKLSLPNDGETYSIKTDEELLHKILSHLVDNAVKFTTKGYVELGFSLNKNLQSNEIEMFVKDSGQGIANDSQKLIFDVFMQENISNTRAHEGSGLGLSIAKGLTKLLGGNIRLESVENEGTTVFVTLPFVESVSSEKTETALHNNIKKKLQTILIAEDDDLNYLYFETILKGRFSKILWAKNGQEAVDLCHKHPEIDLVLMDIKMPVMNGIEATQQIKSFRKDLPIIAVTAFALAGDEHRFLEAGCDDYISKPFAAKKLIELVSKYLK